MTQRTIARQGLGKHILAQVYAHNNRTSIASQQTSKEAFSTREGLCFLLGLSWVIKGQRRSFELLVVEKMIEFWRWRLMVIAKKWKEIN
jgi:hypothetical protein